MAYIVVLLNSIFSYTYYDQCKKTRGRIKYLIIKTCSGDRKDNAIESPFYFIPISQLVTEIQAFKIFKTVQKLWMGSRPIYFLGNAYYVFPGIASIACLEFGIGQWDKARARDRSE